VLSGGGNRILYFVGVAGGLPLESRAQKSILGPGLEMGCHGIGFRRLCMYA
jgi:hypothetical protein